MHLKIDKLLTPLLKLVHTPKAFSYLTVNQKDANAERKSSFQTDSEIGDSVDDRLGRSGYNNSEISNANLLLKKLTRRLSKDSSYQIKY